MSSSKYPVLGALVRVWWQCDESWHEGTVTELRAEHGEFLVDYLGECDGEAWTGVCQPWLAASESVEGARERPSLPEAHAEAASTASREGGGSDTIIAQRFERLHEAATRRRGELSSEATMSAFGRLCAHLQPTPPTVWGWLEAGAAATASSGAVWDRTRPARHGRAAAPAARRPPPLDAL